MTIHGLPTREFTRTNVFLPQNPSLPTVTQTTLPLVITIPKTIMIVLIFRFLCRLTGRLSLTWWNHLQIIRPNCPSRFRKIHYLAWKVLFFHLEVTSLCISVLVLVALAFPFPFLSLSLSPEIDPVPVDSYLDYLSPCLYFCFHIIDYYYYLYYHNL